MLGVRVRMEMPLAFLEETGVEKGCGRAVASPGVWVTTQ